ncbi:MAG TPA: cytochrome c family protein, partial [Anaerolineales bacterium]|nr:cytochrome c family protein [Anaerolineales bacterium]
FHPVSECAECHAAIYDQWSQSMHAYALASPVTVAQTNLVSATTLADEPDARRLCVNCHSPIGARLTSQATLPLESPARAADALVTEGVSCTVCHQFNGEPRSGQGGLKSYNLALRPGRVFFGPLSDPAGNSYHQSQPSKLFAQPEQLCRNCHNVTYDVNDDGQIEKGVDLILQTIFSEWERYRDSGGTQTCVSCHMPLVDAATRVAEAADIPAEQDFASPPRLLHNHSFVGPDYRLDTVTQADPQREARAALLGKAASLAIDAASVRIDNDDSLWFKVSVSNVGAGHNIPGGFSFARQMWLEVIVKDAAGNVLYQSGVLASNVDDLCDSGTLDDPGNPVLPFVQGCAVSDPQLVNFQQKLVSDVAQALDSNGAPILDDHGDSLVIQPEGGEETWVQSLTTGSVSRFRPVDGQELDTIDPGQVREFEYRVDGLNTKPESVTIQVRLLYRNFPPYFLRALAANQLPTDEVRLEPLIGNLQIVEMAGNSLTVELP